MEDLEWARELGGQGWTAFGAMVLFMRSLEGGGCEDLLAETGLKKVPVGSRVAQVVWGEKAASRQSI